MVSDDETEIEVVTPQFDREDGITPESPPETLEAFEVLKQCDGKELSEMGLRLWSSDPPELWLFPHQWYDAIPDELEVVAIDGERFVWGDRETSKDRRFGVLAYGIEVEHDG